jgi:AraC family ethanolamine operon transcriptional activator
MEGGCNGRRPGNGAAPVNGWLRDRCTSMVFLDATTTVPVFGALACAECFFSSVESVALIRGGCQLPAEWAALGYIQHAAAGSWYRSIPLGSGLAFIIRPEDANDFVLSAGSKVSMMLVPRERLHGKLAGMSTVCKDIAGLPRFFYLSESAAAARLLQGLEHVRQELGEQLGLLPVRMSGPDADELLREYLLAAFSALPGDMPVPSRARHVHYLMLRRAETFMRDNLQSEIYSRDICKAIGGSERALRYAFSHLLDTSPMRYLSQLRLNMACHHLLRADPSRRSVKSIALSCGLWDLSRFANSYKQLFGELPHDTLMRSPAIDSIKESV